MGKPSSDFAILADQLREIRQELATLAGRLDAPRHRESIAARPRDRERPDPTPIEVPAHMSQPDTIQDMIRMYVGQKHVDEEGQTLGTFEEEDDFTEDDTEQVPIPANFDVRDYEMEPDEDMPSVTDPDNPEPGVTTPPPPAVDPSPVPETTAP